MARLFIPPPLREAAGGLESIEGAFATAGDALVELAARFPALGARLQRRGALAPGWAIVVDGAVAPLGLRAPLSASSELHILPALGGG